MKTETTRKQFKSMHDITLRFGYCEIANLLQGIQPRFYNSGIYGWNWDGYRLIGDNDIIGITTGYRNMTGDRLPPELYQELEEEAATLYKTINNWEEREKRQKELYKEFITRIENYIKK